MRIESLRGLLVEFRAKRELVVEMLIRNAFVEDAERREGRREQLEKVIATIDAEMVSIDAEIRRARRKIVATHAPELLVRARHLDREIDACRMQLARTPSRRLASGRPRGRRVAGRVRARSPDDPDPDPPSELRVVPLAEFRRAVAAWKATA